MTLPRRRLVSRTVDSARPRLDCRGRRRWRCAAAHAGPHPAHAAGAVAVLGARTPASCCSSRSPSANYRSLERLLRPVATMEPRARRSLAPGAAARGRRGAANQPHLFRRTDLSARRPEPQRPSTGAECATTDRWSTAFCDARLVNTTSSRTATRTHSACSIAPSACTNGWRSGSTISVRRRWSRSCSGRRVLLFGDGRAAAFAALVTALVPELLRWSNTAAVEPSAALFAAFAMMTSVHFVRARTPAALALDDGRLRRSPPNFASSRS